MKRVGDQNGQIETLVGACVMKFDRIVVVQCKLIHISVRHCCFIIESNSHPANTAKVV